MVNESIWSSLFVVSRGTVHSAASSYIWSNMFCRWFTPCARHSVRMTNRPSATLRLLEGLRICHSKFLWANKWILILILICLYRVTSTVKWKSLPLTPSDKQALRYFIRIYLHWANIQYIGNIVIEEFLESPLSWIDICIYLTMHFHSKLDNFFNHQNLLIIYSREFVTASVKYISLQSIF